MEQRFFWRHLADCQTAACKFVFRSSGLDHGLTSQFARAPNLLSRTGQQYTRGYAGTQCALPIRSELRAFQSGMKVVNPVVVI